MAMTVNKTTEEFIELVNKHLGDLREPDPAWRIADSPIAGRGIFATRDIAANEVIFRERSILVGPTAHRGTHLNTCIICYCRLEADDEKSILCKEGCSMPVCDQCVHSERHRVECKLFRKWQPKDLTRINPHALRIVSVIRCFFLSEVQRNLLYAMQANADKYYISEVQRAADCFEHFPKEPSVLEYFYRTTCAFNTNAFEGYSNVGGHEVLVRALFPVAGLLNHECTPNATHHFENAETIVLRATRPIAKGAEVLISYTKLLWSNLARRLFLGITKHFVCSCPRCLDPSENGTFLSALYCREPECKGIVIPVQTKTLQPDWRCTTCDNVFPHASMARYQDFALNTIHNRINSCALSDMIYFINELCPRFCPPSNYVLVEAKLNVIWRMSRPTQEQYTAEQLQHYDRYREEILEILRKLGAGECTLKKLITGEIK